MFNSAFRHLVTLGLDPMQADLLQHDPAMLLERLETIRHTPIQDDAPVSLSVGFTSLQPDTDALTLQGGDGSAVVLRLLTEYRDIDSGTLEKRVKKAVALAESGGKVLDDEQVMEIRAGIKRGMLADTPSKYSSVLILLDFTLQACFISSSSKADLQAVASMLRQLEIDTYRPEFTSNHFKQWIADGHAGRGLMVDDSVTGKRGECKLVLTGGDFGVDWVSDLLSCFDIHSLAFIGYAVNDNCAAPYVHGTWRNDGALVSLKWDFSDEDYQEISDRADYFNAEFDVFLGYVRLVHAQALLAMDMPLQPQHLALIEHRLTADSVTVPGDCDPVLYQQSLNWVLDSQRASISALQRELKIGYNRAAELMEQLERVGVVSKPGIDGNRMVLKARIEVSE